MSFEGFRITENFKVPQLRNIKHQKVGMFGFSGAFSSGDRPQISAAFGLHNDGGIGIPRNKLFGDPALTSRRPAATSRSQVTAFMLAMETAILPAHSSGRPGELATGARTRRKGCPVCTGLNRAKAQRTRAAR